MACIWWANSSSPHKPGWSGECPLVTSFSNACGWPLFWTWACVFYSNRGEAEHLGAQRNHQEQSVKIATSVVLCSSNLMKIARLSFFKEQRECFDWVSLPTCGRQQLKASCCGQWAWNFQSGWISYNLLISISSHLLKKTFGRRKLNRCLIL